MKSLKRGKIFIIGCGPGKRELITIEGEKCLEKSDIFFYFPPYDEIFHDLIKNKKKYFFFAYKFSEIVKIVKENLLTGKNIAFMVPGDFSIFSPFSGFIKIFEQDIEIIPGVGSYSYFAAKIKRVLNACGKIYSVSILSTRMLLERKGDSDFSEYVTENTSLIIYMNTLSVENLYLQLSKIYIETTPVMVGYMLASKDEKIIFTNLKNMCNDLKDFNFEKEKFITIIVGDILDIPDNKTWWDTRVSSYT